MARMGEHEKLNSLLQLIYHSDPVAFFNSEAAKPPLTFLIEGVKAKFQIKSLFCRYVM